MNKKLLILLPALMLSLSACNFKLPVDSEKDEDESQEESHGGGQGQSELDDDIFDRPESLRKLMEFGKNTGFEIKTKATENDDEQAEVTFGMKGNIWWVEDGTGYGTAYRLEDGVCSAISYDDESGSWSVLIADVGESQYTEMFDSLSGYLYTANDYFANNGFEANGKGQYAGRSVLKYKYAISVATVSVLHEYYVDEDLGLTLYHYAETVSDGEKSWAKIETTSFKTGNDVTPIAVSE